MSSSETGLVNQYLAEVQKIATKAIDGSDVNAQLNACIDAAIDHFRVVVGSDPMSTLENFIGQLKFQAGIAEASQPKFADVLRRAAELASRASTTPDN